MRPRQTSPISRQIKPSEKENPLWNAFNPPNGLTAELTKPFFEKTFCNPKDRKVKNG